MLRAAAAHRARSVAPAPVTAVVERFGLRMHWAWRVDAAAEPPDLSAADRETLATLLSLCRLVHPRPVLFDVGAGEGLHALYLKSLCPELEVVAFEPAPAAWGLLERTVRDNAVDGVRIEKIAVGETCASVAPPTTPASCSPPESASLPCPAIVPMRRLDDVSELPAPSLVRIASAADPASVLAGASATLLRCSPLVLVPWPRSAAAGLFAIAARLRMTPFTSEFTPTLGPALPAGIGPAVEVVLIPTALLPSLAAAGRRAESTRVP